MEAKSFGILSDTDLPWRCNEGRSEVIRPMKTKLIALMFIAGGSLFAESRFSISIGGYAPGYYAPPPVYYAPVRPHVLYRYNGGFNRGWRDRNYGRGYGAGY